jgi:hypothetical protein
MGVVALAKRMISRVDDPTELAGEIESLRTAAAAACTEIERLQAARLAAPDYAAAVAVDEELKRQNWLIESASAKLPQLEARLKAAEAERQRHTLARHIAASSNLYPKLRDAIRAAARLQAEAIALREAAIAEIGEHAATVNIPFIAFRGLLLPDLIDLWAGELDRAFATSPQPRALPAPATATGQKPAPPKPVPTDYAIRT